MKKLSLRRYSLLLLLAVFLPLLATRAQNQPKIVTLGADLTPDQRAALLARFGAQEGVDKILTITTPEMTAAMQDIIPIPPGYTSVSSTALTCPAPGSGLHVTTERITRVTAGMFAGALLTAGIGDAELIVAAPPDTEAEGMTALTGIFKGFEGGACGRGEVDPGRRELAYRWLATTNALGNALNDQNAATRVVLQAQRLLATSGNGDPSVAEQAYNTATAETGINPPPEQRDAVIDLLRRIAQANLDWAPFAQGWELQEITPSEVRLTARAASTEQLPGATPGGSIINGQVRAPMGPDAPMIIDAPGQQGQLNLNANAVVVTRDGQPAQLADLQAGDSVTIQIGPDNVAQRIDARTAGAAGARILVGTINDNNEGQITITTAQGQQQFAVPSGAYVAREGQEADIAAVQTQDSATLVLSGTNDIQAVFAQPGGGDYILEGVATGATGPGSLDIRIGAQTVNIPMPAGDIAISRNEQPAAFGDIRPNDRVRVRFNAVSQPTAIEATSGGRFSGLLSRIRPAWLLLGCLVPLLLLLAFLFLRRNQRGGALVVLPNRRRRVIREDEMDDFLG